MRDGEMEWRGELQAHSDARMLAERLTSTAEMEVAVASTTARAATTIDPPLTVRVMMQSDSMHPI